MIRKQVAKKIWGGILVTALTVTSLGLTGCSGGQKEAEAEPTPNNLEEGEAALPKSTSVNPIAGDSDTGDYIYGGDPSVLVDGDTVYLYTGHDTSTDQEVKNAVYTIREYLCYSTTDMVNWKSEGSVMSVDKVNVKWASSSTTAWASQVVRYGDKYYLYYCTWDRTSAGKQSIGVAVSDSPTGKFEDIGEPLVPGTLTDPQTSNWNDIDPTVWVEKDDSGEEHRYLAWGNSRYYICELNEDMISVKDRNGDGKITYGGVSDNADIVNNQTGLSSYTEAPWLYRRQDADGNYYGDYYLFYAFGWREQMAYATTSDLMKGTWKFGRVVMEPTATSNTNHMAVFDFKGKTYFVYHNGSLPAGNGYRRSACITELKFNDDGSVEPMLETASGLNGTTSAIQTMKGEALSHPYYKNSSGDSSYPYSDIKIGAGLSQVAEDSQWVITAGKADKTKDAYASIQSEDKPGLYWTANDDQTVTLAQDADGTEETAKKQTFRAVTGLGDKKGVSLESVSQPGMYVTVKDDGLYLTDGSDADAATFQVS